MENKEFAFIWNTEVKQLFSKCINSDLVGLIYKANDGTITEEEKQKLVQYKKEYVDILAVFYQLKFHRKSLLRSLPQFQHLFFLPF